MKKIVDIDKTINAILKAIIKKFAWFVVIIGIIVMAFALLAPVVKLNFFTSSFTLYLILLTVFTITIFFTFIKSGMATGAEEESYKINYKQYIYMRSGRTRSDTNDYLAVYRKEQKISFEKNLLEELGLTEAKQLSEIPEKDFRHVGGSRDYTFKQKQMLKMYRKGQYPYSGPKSAAQVFNIFGRRSGGSHGASLTAKSDYLIFKSVAKIISVIAFSLLTVGVTLYFGNGNWIDIVIKLALIIFSFAWAIFGGYNTGYIAIAEKEKDSLGAICRFLSEMDIWMEENGRTKYRIPSLAKDEPTVVNKEAGE